MCSKFSIKSQKGFTLVEIMIIIAIIGVLACVVFVASNRGPSKARDARRITEINSVADALESYAITQNNRYYPSGYVITSGGCINTTPSQGFICLTKFLKNKGYLGATSVVDPLNTGIYKYELELGDPDTCAFASPPCGPVDYRLRVTLENKANPGSKFNGGFLDTADGGCETDNKYYCLGGDSEDTFDPGKPVIYLYPEKKEEVAVKIYPKTVVNSIPVYDSGWHVIANPDGKIINLSDNKEYPYLFWDGRSEKPIVDKNKGFVIKSEDVESFLSDKLREQGLNQKEADEFIEFWAPKMKSKTYAYVYFMPQADYDKLVPMSIKPKPDTIIRVYMLFKSLDQPISVEAQQLSSPERKGFTAVEWGGDLSEIK